MRRFVCVLLVLAACDDDGGGDIPIEGLPTAIINTFCDVYVECGLFENRDICVDVFGGDIELDPSLIAAVEAGKVIYHPDKAAECLAGLNSTTCDRTAGPFEDEPEACELTFEGTVPGGGQCAMNQECISQDCDVPACPDACCQGTCVGDVRPARPRVGESCADNFNCVDSRCDFTTMLCTAYLANNSPCTSDTECMSDNCANMVCTPLAGTNEPCTAGGCRLLGDTCSTTSMTCVSYGLTGDPCATGMPCSPLHLLCGPSGTCELRPQLGDVCDPQTTGCIEGYCDATTLLCTTPKADGATCMSNSECSSGDCDTVVTDTCVTPPICI